MYRILLALLGTTIYVAVIFLPMMYDYFFDEEYENDYENTNYIGLALQYVASSFGEAFDGIVDVLNTLLLRPVRFDRTLYTPFIKTICSTSILLNRENRIKRSVVVCRFQRSCGKCNNVI